MSWCRKAQPHGLGKQNLDCGELSSGREQGRGNSKAGEFLVKQLNSCVSLYSLLKPNKNNIKLNKNKRHKPQRQREQREKKKNSRQLKTEGLNTSSLLNVGTELLPHPACRNRVGIHDILRQDIGKDLSAKERSHLKRPNDTDNQGFPVKPPS